MRYDDFLAKVTIDRQLMMFHWNKGTDG